MNMKSSEMSKMMTFRGNLLIACFLIAGCNDMYDGHKLKPLEESKFYADRRSARPLPEGTVARGHARTEELLYTGMIDSAVADVFPFPVTEQVVQRGQDQFNTFCSPCHGRLGDGGGMIVQRGFPRPNSFHSDSVRGKPAGFYFDVITNGFGRMYSYAPSVAVNDRWAIISYIRALQLSQRAPYDQLPAVDKQKISEMRK
jgi:mono/diheme cytochrome c family protein